MPVPDESIKLSPHNISISSRASIILSGIEDVISFDENEIILKSSMGVLSVDGEGLHIIKMSVETGDLSVEGRIDGLFYIDREKPKQGLFKSRRER